MQVKLIPDKAMQNALSELVQGRKVLYVICEPSQMDILKRNSKRANNLKQHKIPVICINNGIRYESISSVSRALGLDPSAVSRCISGKQKSTQGFKLKEAK